MGDDCVPWPELTLTTGWSFTGQAGNNWWKGGRWPCTAWPKRERGGAVSLAPESQLNKARIWWLELQREGCLKWSHWWQRGKQLGTRGGVVVRGQWTWSRKPKLQFNLLGYFHACHACIEPHFQGHFFCFIFFCFFFLLYFPFIFISFAFFSHFIIF